MRPQSTTPVSIPYGADDLDQKVQLRGDKPQRVRCYVSGCKEVLKTPTKSRKGDVCPLHGIQCYYSSAGATYLYAKPSRNIIASPETFERYIIGNPFKYETHRFGLEKSEDALSWNVWRSIQEAGLLHKVATWITGEGIEVEPFLYLWGICTTDDEFRPWDLLIGARNHFEAKLPVERPLTEPDISLHLPGKYLIHIEAKFTSFNTYYQRGARRNSNSLTLDELIGIYQFPGMTMLDVTSVQQAQRVHQQLWRNVVFAEWMAREDHDQTRALHLNLVRSGQDEASANEFQRLVASGYQDRFRQITWEQIHELYKPAGGLVRMLQYLEAKTAGLKPAFRLMRRVGERGSDDDGTS